MKYACPKPNIRSGSIRPLHLIGMFLLQFARVVGIEAARVIGVRRNSLDYFYMRRRNLEVRINVRHLDILRRFITVIVTGLDVVRFTHLVGHEKRFCVGQTRL